jgi:hypothetical protein
MIVPTYATAAAQTAANPTPKAGDVCYRADLVCYETYNGSAWIPFGTSAWTAFTPVWNGVQTMGSAVSAGRYRQLGKTVDLIASLTYGANSVWGSGAVTVNLPAAASSAGGAHWIGGGVFVTSSTWTNLTCEISAGNNTVHIHALNASNQALEEVYQAGLSWATGSVANLQITYEIP